MIQCDTSTLYPSDRSMMDVFGCGVCRRKQGVTPHPLFIITVLICTVSQVTSHTDIRTLLSGDPSPGEDKGASSRGRTSTGDDHAVGVLYGLPDQTAYVGKLFSFKIPHDAFKGPVLQYKVQYGLTLGNH